MFEILATLFVHGELLLDYGQALAAAGWKARAAKVLEAAGEELRKAGRRPLQQRAAEALAALGAAAS